MTRAFGVQRLVSKTGPLVCSEFYTGWIDTWGAPHSKTPTESIIKTLEEVLSMNGNINCKFFYIISNSFTIDFNLITF